MLLADRCFIAIPLAQAFFCESCSAIVNDLHCRLCDSDAHTMSMAAWLNREESRISIPSPVAYLSIVPARQRA